MNYQSIMNNTPFSHTLLTSQRSPSKVIWINFTLHITTNNHIEYKKYTYSHSRQNSHRIQHYYDNKHKLESYTYHRAYYIISIFSTISTKNIISITQLLLKETSKELGIMFYPTWSNHSTDVKNTSKIETNNRNQIKITLLG